MGEENRRKRIQSNVDLSFSFILDSFPAKPLLNDDNKTHLDQPFSLNEWIDKHRDELNNGNAVSLFPDRFQTRVFIFGKGQHAIECSTGDVWLWQLVRLCFEEKRRTSTNDLRFRIFIERPWKRQSLSRNQR